MSDADKLIAEVKGMGFVHQEGKGKGVLEKHIEKRGLPAHLIVLISERDASMLVDINTDTPFKFHFKRNFHEATEFIRDYLKEAREAT